MSVKQLSVFAGNKPGALVSVTETLRKENVDIRAMSVADNSEFGIIHLIVTDYQKAKAALGKNNLVSVDDVLAISVPDRPGAMTDMLKLLAENNVNIEYMYAFLIPSKSGACVVLRVNDNSLIEDLLVKNGFTMISQETINNF